MDQFKRALEEAINDKSLHIEYSKVRSLAEALIEEAGDKGQITKFNAEDMVDAVYRKCGISSTDADEIKNIVAG